MTDEEIQDNVEKGVPSEMNDARSYRRIFKALEREPSFVLPASFASRVISRLETSHARGSRDMYWLYGGIAACLVAMVVSIFITGFKFDFGVFSFISGYPGLITFGIVFVLALQWIDRKIVRKSIGDFT